VDDWKSPQQEVNEFVPATIQKPKRKKSPVKRPGTPEFNSEQQQD